MENIISSKLTLSLLIMLGYGPEDMNTCRKIMITLRNNPHLSLRKEQVQILKDKKMIDPLITLCLDYDDANILSMINQARILHQKYLNEIYFEACHKGKKNIIAFLLKSGLIGVNQTSSSYHLTGMAHATVGNQKQVVEYLHQQGGDINLASDRELNPLIIATIKNKPLMVLWLILFGADIEHRAQSGRTALSIAASSVSKLEILRILLHNGADVNAICNESLTPLQWATLKNNHAAIKLLLQHNANKQFLTEVPWPENMSAENRESINLQKEYMPSLKSLAREKILRLMYTLPVKEKLTMIKALPNDLIENLKQHAERPIAALIDMYSKKQ